MLAAQPREGRSSQPWRVRQGARSTRAGSSRPWTNAGFARRLRTPGERLELLRMPELRALAKRADVKGPSAGSSLSPGYRPPATNGSPRSRPSSPVKVLPSTASPMSWRPGCGTSGPGSSSSPRLRWRLGRECGTCATPSRPMFSCPDCSLRSTAWAMATHGRSARSVQRDARFQAMSSLKTSRLFIPTADGPGALDRRRVGVGVDGLDGGAAGGAGDNPSVRAHRSVKTPVILRSFASS